MKKMCSRENEVWRGASGSAGLLKGRNEVIRGNMWVAHTILERVEDMSEWYGHVLCAESNNGLRE
jgi:hypothetical protein